MATASVVLHVRVRHIQWQCVLFLVRLLIVFMLLQKEEHHLLKEKSVETFLLTRHSRSLPVPLPEGEGGYVRVLLRLMLFVAMKYYYEVVR